MEHHQILGTTYGWEKEAGGVEVLLDAKINKLRVRHVKMSDADCVGGTREHIEISGEIGPDSTAALGRLLPNVQRCKTVSGNPEYRNAVALPLFWRKLLAGRIRFV